MTIWLDSGTKVMFQTRGLLGLTKKWKTKSDSSLCLVWKLKIKHVTVFSASVWPCSRVRPVEFDLGSDAHQSYTSWQWLKPGLLSSAGQSHPHQAEHADLWPCLWVPPNISPSCLLLPTLIGWAKEQSGSGLWTFRKYWIIFLPHGHVHNAVPLHVFVIFNDGAYCKPTCQTAFFSADVRGAAQSTIWQEAQG